MTRDSSVSDLVNYLAGIVKTADGITEPSKLSDLQKMAIIVASGVQFWYVKQEGRLLTAPCTLQWLDNQWVVYASKPVKSSDANRSCITIPSEVLSRGS